MRFVYLDQNFVSRFAAFHLGRIADPIVAELEARLRDLVQRGEVLCPFSAYHVYETSADENDERRTLTCSILGDLSRGVCVKHHLDRVENELQSYLERNVFARSADDLRTRPSEMALTVIRGA